MMESKTTVTKEVNKKNNNMTDYLMQTKDKPFSLSYCSLSTLTSNVRVQALAYWVHYVCMFQSNKHYHS